MRLERLKLSSFKSIKEMDLELRPINILIGANGAGKSNLISFFQLLNLMMLGQLQEYVGRAGGASRLLHLGPKSSQIMEADLFFGKNRYSFSLAYASGDQLVFTREIFSYRQHDNDLGVGHKEAKLPQFADEAEQTPNNSAVRTAKFVRAVLNSWRVYHFADTSPEARVKQNRKMTENRNLLHDAANLASYLFLIRAKHPGSYQQIKETVRLAAPFFDDFVLESLELNPELIRLAWKEMEAEDYIFDAHQLPDGLLRFICLATLFLQPEEKQPNMFIVDEPELGLHPYAVRLLGEMVRGVTDKGQVLFSTQSVNLLDEFEPEDVVVVDRSDKGSLFKRLQPDELSAWIEEEYTLGELWEKNVLGGRPAY